MGIYISGVKGLPEQVQENKENIKDIQEEIEGIDFDAIHNLENQVAENTQDINNMEGTIGTQNIAITNLGGRVDDLEDKTETITRDSDNNTTQVGEDLNVEGNISLGNGKSIILGTDGHNSIESSGNANSYFDFDSSDNPEAVSNGNVYKFTDTVITLNGTPIGGKTLYQHNLKIGDSSNLIATMTLITDSSTALTSRTTIRDILSAKGLDSSAKLIMGSGVFFPDMPIIGFYASGSYLSVRYYNTNTSTESSFNITNAQTITDTVVEIS